METLAEVTVGYVKAGDFIYKDKAGSASTYRANMTVTAAARSPSGVASRRVVSRRKDEKWNGPSDIELVDLTVSDFELE